MKEIGKYTMRQLMAILKKDFADCFENWKGNWDVSKINENMMRQLMAIPREDFVDSFEKWNECWNKYVRSQLKYFKETNALDWQFLKIYTG